MNRYENIVIGLEVHVQLKTQSKLFCDCPNEFGQEPNRNTCPVCLGLPGSLPVLNRKAVDYAVRAARALNCRVLDQSKYDRKNYYYPDLPKGYQISQYDKPLAREGTLIINRNGQSSEIKIERLHLEEDAGKLIHASQGDDSYVDFNRAGTPLIEIVTRPVLSDPAEAVAYLETLKKRMEYTGVSDCNMEEGSLRCDANLSVRREDGSLGVKTEVKNMNSFSAVESALSSEAGRQQKLLDRGESVKQGTRLWDEENETTRSMRTKEAEHDYRYFPEPDLVPLEIDASFVDRIDDELPEMPDKRLVRFQDQYDLQDEEAKLLTSDRFMADYFEAAAKELDSVRNLVNLMTSDLRRELNDREWTIEDVDLRPDHFAEIAELLREDVISSNVASDLVEELIDEDVSPRQVVEERELQQISDEDQLSTLVEDVFDENPEAVADVKNGKDEAIGFLIGQVMQKTDGQANPQQAREVIREALDG